MSPAFLDSARRVTPKIMLARSRLCQQWSVGWSVGSSAWLLVDLPYHPTEERHLV